MLQYAAFGYTKDVYALDPSTFKVTNVPTQKIYVYRVEAVWLGRRKSTKRRAAFKGYAYARSGNLWTYQEFLNHCTDISGGDIWDGEEVWGATKLKEQIAIAEYLDPVLQNGPQLSAQWDGWYEIVKK